MKKCESQKEIIKRQEAEIKDLYKQNKKFLIII